MNKKEKYKRDLESGLLELAGLETTEEAEAYRKMQNGALDVGRLTWEETFDMIPS